MVIAFLLCAFVPLSSARSELLFAESFTYSPGKLDGLGPPPGSPPGQGGWVANNNEPRVAPHGLYFGAGNCARLHNIFGTLSDEAIAAIGPVMPDYGVVWIGFLMRKPTGDVRDGFAVVVAIGESISDPSVGIGMLFDRGRYGLDNNTGDPGSKSLSDVMVSGQITWLVTKLDFIAGEEYLWINPSSDSEPDITDADADLKMTPEFQAVGFRNLRLRVGYGRAVFHFDELRAGTEFADVVLP